MQVILIKKEKLFKYPFPNKNISNFWIKDYDESGNERELIEMSTEFGKWVLKSNDICQILTSSNNVKEVVLSLNNFYFLKTANENMYLFICEENDPKYESYLISNDGEFTIGKEKNQSICFKNAEISDTHAILTKNNQGIFLDVKDATYGAYVNNKRVVKRKIKNGDIIFIMGLRIIVINNYLLINNYNGNLTINSPLLIKQKLNKENPILLETEENENLELYNENDYFSRSPRFVTSIIKEEISIDSPPTKVEEDEMPVIYTIGPMITMAMSSAVTASVSIINVVNGKGNFLMVLPTIVITITMIISTILWPTLMRRYNKKRKIKKEEERQTKYIEYLRDKKQKIEDLRTKQYQILMENYPDPKNLAITILNRKMNLWERLIESDDFLNVRLGLGTISLKINLSYSIEDFTMSNDNLKEELNKVAESARDIDNAPFTISLTDRNKLSLIGDNYNQEEMLKSIILQLATNHSYNDLKLVFMVNDASSEIWNDFKILPHTWSNSREIRFFANNYDEMSKISFYLEQVFMQRKYTEEDGKRIENNITYKNVSPYYLIVVDNIKKNKNIEIINKVLKENNNIGFGLIVLNEGIANLPNEINNFLIANANESAIITTELSEEKRTFVMDSMYGIDYSLLCEKLSNIPLKLPLMLDDIKSSLGFLEMYKVGKIEQLNILNRWESNNPVNSLSVPIGVHTDGEIFNLDLHEKFHGPHGLIAGMTGSGKSEFIITFILSICLNFSPEEVSFVLIDYKGGGLTGAFENKLTGFKLPHLAGTITNLDAAEIKRSLASIQSELKRRQALFNKAKVELNESTLDIYKYQKLYRDGLINEPISHLFIVSDEFAELKQQQPEFMTELISTARIGRSLGVHLILATQKPSGIVDDQIWSNSKFKVCLKVQEKSDSMDVIKCPDAATLKNVGRFYLQVGYNDYFAMGQAAYAGVKYIPKDKISKTVDHNISFINNIGDTIKSIETITRKEEKSFGEELPNILNYIGNAANEKKLAAKKLWLDKIPEEIFVNDLMKKYSFIPEKWLIKVIIGEYDDPNNQSQGLLTLDLNSSGNTLVYGASGSGKEILLTSVIYSLIISHSSEEINIYVLDFGSEMFGIFKTAPQVGDVAFMHEEEKIANLFGIINRELEIRKKLFVDYNGDYNLYIKQSGKTLPRMIIIVNNYEALNENYEDYIDVLSGLTREGERYGIVFLITASGANAVRGKTSQNFSNVLCLQFNDPSDYSSLLGVTHGMVPSENVGRGLFKFNNTLYEFQTAYPYKWSDINSFIKDICQNLRDNLREKAKTIAVLPDHVRLDNIKNNITTLKSVPVGIEKDTLEVSKFDFAKNPISLISSQDVSIIDKFVSSLGEVIGKIKNTIVYIFDFNEYIKDNTLFTNYYSKDADLAFDTLENAIKLDNNTHVFMIYGIDNFKNLLNIDKQSKFFEILNNLKNISNIKVIIIDDVTRIKAYEYEDFYRNNVQPTFAIWIGSGVTDQFTIKCSTYNKETRSQIENSFGYNIFRGSAKLIKVLDFYSKDE